MQIGAYSSSVSCYNQSISNTQKAMLKIATAQKINSAADDSANLAISQLMQGQINGLAQAYDNTGNAVSMLNTADSAMSNSTDVMQQMRQLSVEAANGTLTDADRASIQQEMSQLQAQVDTTANNTQFNTIQTNNGTLDAVIQTGANSGQTANISIASTTSSALGINNPDVSTQAAAENTIGSMDNALGQISSTRGQVGVLTNGLNYTGEDLSNTAVNLQVANSNYTDTDMASAITSLNQSKIQSYINMMALKTSFGQQQGTLSLLA